MTSLEKQGKLTLDYIKLRDFLQLSPPVQAQKSRVSPIGLELGVNNALRNHVPRFRRQREMETAAVLNEKPKPLDLENENEEKEENQQNPVASDTSFWDTEDEEEIYSEKENRNFLKPSDRDLSLSRFLQEKKVKVNEEEDDDSSIFDISGFDDSLDLNKKEVKPKEKVNLQKAERPKTAVRRKENPNPNNSWDSD